MGVFEQAISNVAYLRAQVGGGMSRLNFAAESISSMETNLRAAIGRSRMSISQPRSKSREVLNINQAAAAMVSQANSTKRCGTHATEVGKGITVTMNYKNKGVTNAIGLPHHNPTEGFREGKGGT